jgi:hypothetical protein
MIDYKYPTIASGATPIGNAGHAPDEELLREERGRKIRVHYRWQTPENKLDIYSHPKRRLCIDKEPDDFGSLHLKSKFPRSRRLKKSKFEEVKD